MAVILLLGLCLPAQVIGLLLASYWFRGPGWRRYALLAIIFAIGVEGIRRTLILYFSIGPTDLRVNLDLASYTVLSLLFPVGIIVLHSIFESRDKSIKALDENELVLHAMIQYQPGVVFRCDFSNGRTMSYLSRGAETLTGYPTEVLLHNKRLFYDELIYPDDKCLLKEIQEKIFQHHDYNLQYRLIHKNGKVVWVHERGRGVFDNSGNLLFVTGFISDITERVEMEALFAVQHELALELLHVARLDQTLVLCLDAAIKISGMDCGGIYLIDPHQGHLHLACYRGLPQWFIEATRFYEKDSFQAQLISKGKPVYTCYDDELLALDKVGIRERLKAIAVVPVRYENNVIACINVASHTRSKVPTMSQRGLETLAGLIGQAIVRVRAQQHLAESEANLSTLFSSIRDMLFVLDRKGKILRVNHAVLHVLGYTEEELLQKPIQWLQSPPHENKASDGNTLFLEREEGSFDIVLYTQKGESIPVEITTVTNTWNVLPAFFLVARDITDRLKAEEHKKLMERQMEMAFKLESLGLLAGGVAHDFNNLLSVIKGNAELIREGMREEALFHKNLDIIIQTSRHASDLCRQLMIYSGRGTLEEKVFYLTDLLQEMFPLIQSAVPKTISLVLALDKTLPLIKGDMSQIRRVIMNLTLNAKEAIGDNDGTITLSLSKLQVAEDTMALWHLRPENTAGPFVVLSVSDTGCGMSDAMQKRIFDPYFSTKFIGRGLGLSSVLGIVRAHKGGIEVQSTMGQGTQIRIFFPAKTDTPLATDHQSHYHNS